MYTHGWPCSSLSGGLDRERKWPPLREGGGGYC